MAVDAEAREVRNRVETALKQLSVSDSYLLRHGAHEHTIVHRFARHLENHFDGWDVDVEYGLEGNEPPPDVVVHRRGSPDKLLAVELRRGSGDGSADDDRRKLRGLKDDPKLAYRYACLVELGSNTAGKPTFEVEFL